MTPIYVRHLSDDKYEVVIGRARVQACLVCGIDEIPAIVMSDDEYMLSQIVASKTRVPTARGEYRSQLKRLMVQRPELTRERLASLIQKPLEWINTLLEETDDASKTNDIVRA